MFRELRFTIDQLAVESRQCNNPKVVFVRCGDHFVSYCDGTEQFLLNFAFESLSGRFARFNLATREFPHASETATESTLRAKNLIIPNNNCPDNIDLLLQHNPPLTSLLIKSFRYLRSYLARKTICRLVSEPMSPVEVAQSKPYLDRLI